MFISLNEPVLAITSPLALMLLLAVMCPWADAVKCKLPPNCISPCTSNFAFGAPVPIPTLLVSSNVNVVVLLPASVER